jgi:hypothetical protein
MRHMRDGHAGDECIGGLLSLCTWRSPRRRNTFSSASLRKWPSLRPLKRLTLPCHAKVMEAGVLVSPGGHTELYVPRPAFLFPLRTHAPSLQGQWR